MDAGHQISYQSDDRHTLSLYLKGGTTNLRVNQSGIKGAPGKICLMPQYQDSQWIINERVEFVHLYFNDTQLKQYAAESFGIDVRFVELRELTFLNEPVLKNLFVESFLLCRNFKDISPLFAEQSLQKVMHHLLSNHNGYTPTKALIKGGLSPFHIKQVRELIYADVGSKLSIALLAQQVNLSPYHFARMFKLSFGESPASYITRVRVNKIKQLLESFATLADISQQAGFSQQAI
jgi:AraC family transcriptional regulator